MAIFHRIDTASVAALKTDPALRQNMLRRGIRVQSTARRLLTSRRPGVDTGRLRSSVSVDQFQQNGTVITRVGSNVEYALFVHDGTYKMRGNPFLRDALPSARD